MKGAAQRALLVGGAIAAALGVLHLFGVGLPLLLVAAALFAFIGWALPFIGVRMLDSATLAVRGLYWRREQGRFHSFDGVPLQIEDDGRHCWVDGDGLQQVLATRDSDAVLAARHAGQWRRAADDTLMLRVDAVVQQLATMPGRDAPRVQRLRRYLERDVLYPAAQRRRRKQHGAADAPR